VVLIYGILQAVVSLSCGVKFSIAICLLLLMDIVFRLYFNKLSVSMVLSDRIAYLRGALGNIHLWFGKKPIQLLKRHCLFKKFRGWMKSKKRRLC
jgi:hypothetical protein